MTNNLDRLGLQRLREQISAIGEVVGTPFYVYDFPTLRRTTEALLNGANQARLKEQARFYLALFALPNLRVLDRLLRVDERIGLACNTPEEIRALHRSGWREWHRSVFSGGVLKSDQLRQVALTGALFHASSIGNVEELAALAEAAHIGLRLDLYNNALKGIRVQQIEACARLLRERSKNLSGLHAYPGTQLSNPDALTRHVEVLLEVASSVPTLEEVNFGGGFHYDYNDRPGGFLSHLSFNEYFETVRYHAAGWLANGGRRLSWEPGRVVFAGAGFFVTEIVEVRSTGVASADYYVDASFTQMPAPKLLSRQHYAVVLTRTGDVRCGSSVQARVCGATTLSTDQLLPRECILPIAESGDFLVILDMGAYGRAGAYSFLGKALPPEVLIEETGWMVVSERDEPNYCSRSFESDESACENSRQLTP